MNVWMELLQPGDAAQRHADWHVDGRLAACLPEVDALFGVPQPAEHHPEVDTGVHIGLCLEVATRLELSPRARFGVLLYDLGKALTPVAALPSHPQHENNGLPVVQRACSGLRQALGLQLLPCAQCHHGAHPEPEDRLLVPRMGQLTRSLPPPA